MESVRVWARGLFLLAVFSSTVMLLVPKSMVKQAKFVCELLLLLCVIAPLSGLLRSGSAALPSSQPSNGFEGFSLGEFYSKETSQRVIELGVRAGIDVESVKVTTKEGGLALSEVAVVIVPGAPDEDVAAFKEAIGIYAGIPKDKVKLTVGNP